VIELYQDINMPRYSIVYIYKIKYRDKNIGIKSNVVIFHDAVLPGRITQFHATQLDVEHRAYNELSCPMRAHR